MSDVQRLFREYVRIRDAGYESRPTVEQLWPQIRALPDVDKQSLKVNIHEWEQRGQTAPESLAAPATPAVRHFVVEPDTGDDDVPELVETLCPYCGRPNRIGEVMCYACGQALDPNPQDHQRTRILQQTTGLFYSDEFFGDDFVLMLTVRNEGDGRGSAVYELRPQEFQRKLNIGRLADGSEVIPDIDLSPFDAETRGVSRLHLNLFYDPGDSVIRIVDHVSANGTFVNGQRLHRNEVRVLHSGDDIRLGHLVLTARFYTPDFG